MCVVQKNVVHKIKYSNILGVRINSNKLSIYLNVINIIRYGVCCIVVLVTYCIINM